MIVEAQVTINGSRTATWAAITDIENASEILSGVDNIAVLKKAGNRARRAQVAGDPHAIRQAGDRGEVDH